jgi:hypothetical protein
MTDGRQGPTTADIAERPVAEETDERERDDARGENGRQGLDTAETESLEPLLSGEQTERYRARWVEMQTSFVDEPRQTVEEADRLVAELMQKLAAGFSEARSTLEEQWTRGDDVSTEDLREALRRYRSFFERLLAV